MLVELIFTVISDQFVREHVLVRERTRTKIMLTCASKNRTRTKTICVFFHHWPEPTILKYAEQGEQSGHLQFGLWWALISNLLFIN